jgi:hypothetical protein
VRRALLSCLVLLLAGCAQTVTVRTEPPGAKVRLGEGELEPIPKEGARAKVPRGVSDVPWSLEREGVTVRGVVERSRISWGWVAAAVGGALCCTPPLALGGACMANPGLALAAAACVSSSSPVLCCAALASPSWATVPLASLGALVGLSPLSLALLAETVPEELVLPPPSAAGVAF